MLCQPQSCWWLRPAEGNGSRPRAAGVRVLVAGLHHNGPLEHHSASPRGSHYPQQEA